MARHHYEITISLIKLHISTLVYGKSIVIFSVYKQIGPCGSCSDLQRPNDQVLAYMLLTEHEIKPTITDGDILKINLH